MPTPFVSKLIALGFTTLMGGAGLLMDDPSPPASPNPSAPEMVAAASGTMADEPRTDEAAPPNAVLSSVLARVSPEVLREPAVARALRDPAIRAALSDPAVAQAIRGIDPAVLTRPAVLEAIRTRQISPALLSDPVVSANLPAIMAALPTLRRAFEGIPTSAIAPTGPVPGVRATRTAATDDAEETEHENANQAILPRPNGRRAAAHARRDARRTGAAARRVARRALRFGRNRGRSAQHRRDLRVTDTVVGGTVTRGTVARGAVARGTRRGHSRGR